MQDTCWIRLWQQTWGLSGDNRHKDMSGKVVLEQIRNRRSKPLAAAFCVQLQEAGMNNILEIPCTQRPLDSSLLQILH
jgi:hypothetical protein